MYADDWARLSACILLLSPPYAILDNPFFARRAMQFKSAYKPVITAQHTERLFPHVFAEGHSARRAARHARCVFLSALAWACFFGCHLHKELTVAHDRN
jgi:hypothetical protein